MINEQIRNSTFYQARLATIGEKMNLKIWLPKNDRIRVNKLWHPSPNVLLDSLPMNYDSRTIDTIEQIDVIWIFNRAIMRAFEVEDTTTVSSGILRMANLMAIQPNIHIKAHIVAPTKRKSKVMKELSRPLFEGPVVESCSYISYDAVDELWNEKQLRHMNHTVLEEYAQYVSRPNR